MHDVLLLGLGCLFFRIQGTDGVVCDNCQITANGACLTAGTCQGNYCLYEYRVSQGQTVASSRCIINPQFTFDDNSQLTQINQCYTKSTPNSQYRVKMCNTGDFCSRSCTNPIDIAPPAPGTSVCYQCTTYDGTDCAAGQQCTAPYCTYQRRQSSNGQTTITRGCAITPVLQFDDGTQLTVAGSCDTRNIQNSVMTSLICSGNYCNSGTMCGGNLPPQYDPRVTCYSCAATNQNDCITTASTCQSNYCLFERQRQPDGNYYVKRSCIINPVYIYPDGTQMNSLNQCVRRKVGTVDFSVNICNTDRCPSTPCSSSTTLLSLVPLLIVSIFFLK